jgi:hypothetical protein
MSDEGGATPVLPEDAAGATTTEWDEGTGEDELLSEEISQAVASPPLQYCPLELERVEVLLPATHARLVLRELEGERRYLVIPIGMPDASAIAIASQGLMTPRPLTHELFCDVMMRFGITIETVRIAAASESSFRAELVLSGSVGTRVLDCRPSDGIALALRQGLPVPITVSAEVLDQLGADSAS